MNIKDLRFREMEETGNAVTQELTHFSTMLQLLRVFNDGGEFETYCLSYLRSKLDSKPLRAYFSRKVFEYVIHYLPGWEVEDRAKLLFYSKLPFLFEVIITIQYLHNQILDQKYEARGQNHPKINQNLITSNILRELVHLYIEKEIRPLVAREEKLALIHQKARQLLLRVDLGQYIDKKLNNYTCYKLGGSVDMIDDTNIFDRLAHAAIGETIKEVKAKCPEKSAFVEAYFRRIYLSNVYFFRCIAETVVELLEFSGMQRDRLFLFSTQYGYMLQIVNDYADFAYSEDKEEQKILKVIGKKTTDILSDLYNFNITLPLIFHLQHGRKNLIERYLEEREKTRSFLKQFAKQIRQEITSTGSIHETIKIARDIGRAAKNQLDLEQDLDHPDMPYKNPHTAFFVNMCEMGENNKFLQIFR